MKRQYAIRKITAVLLGVLFIAWLLVMAKFQSQTPKMALSSLTTALQNNDQPRIKELTTMQGFSSLQTMTMKIGRKRLGDYLASHKSAQATPNVAFSIVVFEMERSKTPPVTVFFKWTWNGWKLSSINGSPAI